MSEEILNEAVAEAPLSQDYHDYLNEDGQIVADPRLMLGEENKPEEITTKDLLKVWFRWWWANESRTPSTAWLLLPSPLA